MKVFRKSKMGQIDWYEKEIEYNKKQLTSQMKDAENFRNYEYQLQYINSNLLSGKFIIEIGAGAGKFSFLLAEKFPQSQIIATDLTASLIQYAHRINTYSNLAFGVADCGKLPFPNRCFDIVWGGSFCII